MSPQDTLTRSATLRAPPASRPKCRFVALMRRDPRVKPALLLRKTASDAQVDRSPALASSEDAIHGTYLGRKLRRLRAELQQLELALSLPSVSIHGGPHAERLARGIVS